MNAEVEELYEEHYGTGEGEYPEPDYEALAHDEDGCKRPHKVMHDFMEDHCDFEAMAADIEAEAGPDVDHYKYAMDKLMNGEISM